MFVWLFAYYLQNSFEVQFKKIHTKILHGGHPGYEGGETVPQLQAMGYI